jgi:hypothetical protein
VAGYPLNTAATAQDEDNCPEGIESWIMQRIAQKYEDRKPGIDRQQYLLDRSFVDGLLDEHVLIEVNP